MKPVSRPMAYLGSTTREGSNTYSHACDMAALMPAGSENAQGQHKRGELEGEQVNNQDLGRHPMRHCNWQVTPCDPQGLEGSQTTILKELLGNLKVKSVILSDRI